MQDTNPQHLRISEGFVNPIGFYDDAPRFSWQFPDALGNAQSAYRIVVASSAEALAASPDIWDSGKVDSDQSVWIPYLGKPLRSRQRAFWQVKVWSESGNESNWSEPASFELGLLHNADWCAHWIQMEKDIKRPDTDTDNASGQQQQPDPFVPEYLRKAFQLDGEVTQARLFVTAKGLYELYINGMRVGEDTMTPGWTPYHKRIETLTYDVSCLLRKGDNALGSILGEGWYAGRMMGDSFYYPEALPALLLQLEITYSDGRRETIVSDNTWKACNHGPIRFSGIYNGEIYDANLEMPNWNCVDFDDAHWSNVIADPIDATLPLVPKRHAPVRVTAEIETVALTEPEPGTFIFDLGQNMVGRPQISIPVENGKTVSIRFAEMLNADGTLHTENYRAAKSTDTYTAACSGSIIWEPTFTFHGFRYVQLSGFPAQTQPERDWVKGQVLHSDFAQAGTFNASHAMLNKLQENITWGQRGNFLEIPTDCPQRNERLGWTGDAQVFCPTSLFNYDVHAFWMSWLQSVREEQGPDGRIPNVVPNTLDAGGSPGWGDVAVVSPWDIYVRTGDTRVLLENYEMMKGWIGLYENEANDCIVDRQGFGDWLQPLTKERVGDTPRDLIATAYFGRCANIMTKVARILGHDADANHYAKLFASIADAFSRTYFDASGKLTTPVESQTGYLMALGYGLIRPEQHDGAVMNLIRKVNEADGHLRTGFLGTPLIAMELDRAGYPDAAFEVLFKETYPSWFYSINQGATTMWERWNSYSHEDGFGNARMNSFNHYAYGAIGQWMYERIAGLAPDPEQPGYKHFFVQPLPGGPLTFAEAELKTPYGLARSAWKTLNDGTLLISATVPRNTTATLIIPTNGAGGTPMVVESGQTCQTIWKDGRLTYELDPGMHVFVVSEKATVSPKTAEASQRP